ncbi:hypothetical protein G7B40_027225 [Aetokthonos hydrillicola Thurmond2011]|jgi:hypothetical protein|uniref:Uncharacterized protein n=1 Tax=Aetokthonos hydrillicola Thurmond2011 TaxID=2712845 RepID=A0AAP5IDB1_9CYAN|nr:hypothetical protein [Aetokthonos hydrillicola]MBO3463442.1 hypothetical protein [Aetokthonos hydrillicola CCALA 1050]MBW4588949.1 hypothetical protein [Aetokthonos hydrillicola CCALA 1050]MDR9898224.1 hypothetical protein [Aetokthonos hydrillicola Thurmond2011]
MFKKSVAFGLLVAGLMVAPTAAFAGSSQSQNNVQTTEQNGAATNGSTNAQSSNSVNVQKQISNITSRSHRYGGLHRGWGKTPHASQAQNSDQKTTQNGAADNNSTNAQTSTTTNNQTQNSAVARNLRRR